MKFRVQAFDPGRNLLKGIISASNEAEAREKLKAAGLGPIAQCDARPLLRGPASEGVELSPSEQFIREPRSRKVILRLQSGMAERHLVGHVEMLGGKEYVQLWTCIAVYVFTALAFWSLLPAVYELDLREWFTREQPAGETANLRAHQQDDARQWLYEQNGEGVARIDAVFLKASFLTLANSGLTLLALMITLGLKQSLPRIGLTLLAVYAIQWFACGPMVDLGDGSGSAVRFLTDHPFASFMAWIVPAMAMIATERALRYLLEMTVPVYENPESGEYEVGGRNLRQV